jgi:hypothetical protein
MSDHWKKVPALITRLYEITDELESMFRRKFTPDGHLVGSVGEAMAVYMYDLELTEPNFKTHDAKTKDGRLVQIKFTAGSSGYGIYAKPDYLIALRLMNRRDIVEVFNGPGDIAWGCVAGKASKNGPYSMAMGKLERLGERVAENDKIRRVRELRLF